MKQIPLKTNYLTHRVSTHSQKVCNLYKRALRQVLNYNVETSDFRYYATILRAHFDLHAKEKDMRKAKSMLEIGEHELFLNQFPQPFQFASSPGGVAYQREWFIQDTVLDSWHPLEKAQYPEYFKRREERKEEWIKMWEKNYNHGKPWDIHEKEWKGNWAEPLPSDAYKS